MTKIMCNDCQRRFNEYDTFVDHLEDSHSAISRLVRRRSTILEEGVPTT